MSSSGVVVEETGLRHDHIDISVAFSIARELLSMTVHALDAHAQSMWVLQSHIVHNNNINIEI